MESLFERFDPAEVYDAVRQYSLDLDLLEEKLPELLQTKPYQWAGVFRGELKVYPLHQSLVAAFGGDIRCAVVRFLNPESKKQELVIAENLQPA